MINKIKNITGLILAVLILSACEGDEPFFGTDTIFTDAANYPYVSIQDLNEDLEDITGNNFWNFELTSEADGTQVRIEYDCQDPNVVSHSIFVGFENDDDVAPLPSDALVRTITTFPTVEVITKQDVAAALSVDISTLDSGSVYFRGSSMDADGNIVDNAGDFEDFLVFERHAYFYEWELDQ